MTKIKVTISAGIEAVLRGLIIFLFFIAPLIHTAVTKHIPSHFSGRLTRSIRLTVEFNMQFNGDQDLLPVCSRLDETKAGSSPMIRFLPSIYYQTEILFSAAHTELSLRTRALRFCA